MSVRTFDREMRLKSPSRVCTTVSKSPSARKTRPIYCRQPVQYVPDHNRGPASSKAHGCSAPLRGESREGPLRSDQDRSMILCHESCGTWRNGRHRKICAHRRGDLPRLGVGKRENAGPHKGRDCVQFLTGHGEARHPLLWQPLLNQVSNRSFRPGSLTRPFRYCWCTLAARSVESVTTGAPSIELGRPLSTSCAFTVAARATEKVSTVIVRFRVVDNERDLWW